MTTHRERLRSKTLFICLGVSFLIGATMLIWPDAPWALLPPAVLIAGVVSAWCASHRSYAAAAMGAVGICAMWGLGFSIVGFVLIELDGDSLIGGGEFMVVVAFVIVAGSTPVFVLWAVIFTMLLRRFGAQPNDNDCPTCGYSLTGLRERRCPECGHKAPSTTGLPHDSSRD